MTRLALVIHNVRSAHNVGSLLRSADGFGVEKVYLTGYTPYPELKYDNRLPHLRQKISKQIKKTALGAERSLNLIHEADIDKCLTELSADGFMIVALEQTPRAKNLIEFKTTKNIALILGNEVSGLESDVLKANPDHIKIPMLGQKESLNVSIAGAIALYHLRWTT
jgi:23S rRNA (guanosine2251-2'-O)-methyltransferase